jgi:Icc-related predicted phosphoesterase
MPKPETAPGRIIVSGDWHGNTNHAYAMIDRAVAAGVPRIFQVGDFGAWEHMHSGISFFNDVAYHAEQNGVTVYWLDGNHDKTSLVLKLYGDNRDDEGFLICRKNLRYAPRGHRWTWNGVRFMALGGAYSVDKQWRIEREIATRSPESLWFPEEEMNDNDLDTILLTDSSPIDVLLTHDKPRASNPGWNRKDYPECRPNQDRIQRAVTVLQPKLLIHGHLHYRYTDQIRSFGDSWTTVVGLDADPQAASSYNDKDSWVVLDLDLTTLDSSGSL